MRFITFTLGCKVNQYETELIRETFRANGWEETQELKDAQFAVVNTCSVTAESDAKCRKLISHIARQAPNAQIAVTGCYAASDPERLRALANVAYVLPDKRKLPEFFRQLGLTDLPDGISSLQTRHRAYIKVQDGCRVGCAYCQIPLTRPYLASRRVDEILREAQRLADAGYREIVLTGIHLGHYGLDFDAIDYPASKAYITNLLCDYQYSRNLLPPEKRHTLTALLTQLLAHPLPLRYRLGSLEAVETPNELIRLAAESQGKLCPHFHLSMQSGSDPVLKRMRRRWLSGPFFDRCQEIQELLPGAALTTDVIVGFPGETDEDFAATCDTVQKIGFAKTHIFRFSSRPGTVAAQMPDQIPESVKKQRAKEMENIARQTQEKYAQTLVGHEVEILVEEIFRSHKTLSAEGTSEYYLTGSLEGEELRPGALVRARVVSADGEKLRAVPQ